MNITVLGAGSWGLALACLLNNNGHNITVWGRNEAKLRELTETRQSSEYLPDLILSENIIFTSDLEKAMLGSEITVLSVSSQSVRTLVSSISVLIPDNHIIVSTSKGFESGTLMLMSEVIESAAPTSRAAVLSGPSHAEEVSRGIPTTCVAASEHLDVATIIQDAFMSENFRVYINEDIRGVEIGGALKNIISLAAGISDGMGFGDNTKAALMTRGIVEISRLAVAMGALESTIFGLSGIGDLIVTCMSKHSRNWRAGYLLGQGKSLEEAQKEIHMVVEGIFSAKSALELSEKNNIEMPITYEINQALFFGKSPTQAVFDLVNRDKKIERTFLGND